MNAKNKSVSINAKLVSLAHKRGVTFQSLSTAFLIERLLARIVSSKNLAGKLVFKGGYVGFRVYNSERYTVDLDALLIKSDVSLTLEQVAEQALTDLNDGTWFELESQIDLKTQGEYGGVRQVFRGGIGEKPKNIRKAQVIHFDLGIGDPVSPAPVEMNINELIGDDQLSWFVYPIETIIAEKLQTLIIRGGDNSRAKDIYDLYFYLPKADLEFLKVAINKCFKFRETKIPKDFSKSLRAIDTTLLEKGWPSVTASLKTKKSFSEVFNFLIKEFEKIKKLS